MPFKSYLPLYGLAGFDLFRGLDWLDFFLGGDGVPYEVRVFFKSSQISVEKHRWSLDRSWTNWPIGGRPSRFCWRHFQKKNCWMWWQVLGWNGCDGEGFLLWFLAWFLFPELDGSYGQRDVVICLYKLMSPKHVGKKSAQHRCLLKQNHETSAGHGVDCHFAELLAHIIRVREP